MDTLLCLYWWTNSLQIRVCKNIHILFTSSSRLSKTHSGINYKCTRKYCIYTETVYSLKAFIFCWPCISLQILANNQLDALFHLFIYFISIHVSSITVLINRRSNCINTSSGMISLCDCLVCRSGGNSSQCSSSGDQIVLIHHLVWLVCVTACYAGQEGTHHSAHHQEIKLY